MVAGIRERSLAASTEGFCPGAVSNPSSPAARKRCFQRLIVGVDSMEHVDVQLMKPYQHHRFDPLREVIDHRNEANGLCHVYVTGAKTQAKGPAPDFSMQLIWGELDWWTR